MDGLRSDVYMRIWSLNEFTSLTGQLHVTLCVPEVLEKHSRNSSIDVSMPGILNFKNVLVE